MTIAMTAAKERQLDWLLDEVLGGGRAAAPRRGALAMPWLAAAIALFAIGAALGVAWLRAHEDDSRAPVQQPAPAIPWRECHGPGALDAVPADVTALKCFDFDDAACARLAKFTKLEHLDLSGMDVNDKGYAVSLTITDKGVRALAPLVNLRSLSLATCWHMKGAGLRVLEAMPRLEQLDLTYSGVETLAVERLARLPNLRTLSLASCMNFNGRAIAAVASIPGLRALDLRACVTMSAKDALPLAKLKELRRLDLRDCQGRFRGQTESGFAGLGADATDDPESGDPSDPNAPATFVDTDHDGIPDKRVALPPPPPVQDGIGITDEVVEALAALPLETLELGGSESLTDAIGPSIAKMATLRSLDLSNLPKTSGALLANVPEGLTSLALDDNAQVDAAALRRLPALAQVRELGLGGLPKIGDADLETILHGKSLQVLRLSGASPSGKDVDAFLVNDALLGVRGGAAIATQKELRHLALRNARTLDPAFLGELAKLPHLTELDLTGSVAGAIETMRPLAACRALRSVTLMWCRSCTLDGLRELAGTPLEQLDLYGTNLRPEDIVELAKAWPNCAIKMPAGTPMRRAVLIR